MYEFDFWYAYFDSIFLKSKPVPFFSFIQTFNLKELKNATFQECKRLPQLTNCFQEFQKFIFTPQTWIQCECDQNILTEIEDSVNLCVILINIEKKYAQDFWHLKRRIQASICHFFALLIFFIVSLIPCDEDTQTIQETKKLSKLCTSLKSLENFVNKILPFMNSIIKFLYQQSFSEEKKLTILFLQQIKEFLLNLPKVNRKKFSSQFQLSKFLYLIIPIEVSKNQYKFKAKRKKAATISNEVQMKYQSDDFISRQSNEGSIIQIPDQKRKFSLPQINKRKQKLIYRTKIINKNIQKQKDDFYDENLQINNNNFPKLFQFSEKVRKCSFYVSQKKVTKATLKTRQTLEFKLQLQKLRKKSDFGKTSESNSKQKQFVRTFSIQKQRYRTNETIRSKKSSFYRAHRKTQVQQSQKLRHHKQKSIVKQKIKKNFDIDQIISKPYQQNFLDTPSKKVNLFSGKSQGWGIVQDQFNKKSLLKSIHKLIHSNQIF